MNGEPYAGGGVEGPRKRWPLAIRLALAGGRGLGVSTVDSNMASRVERLRDDRAARWKLRFSFFVRF